MAKLPLTKVLLIILALQGGILLLKNPSAAILQVSSSSSEFIKLASDSVKKIKLQQGENELELNKDGEDWVISSMENFPADRSKIERFLADLQSLRATSPIATSLSAAKKLKTGTDDFEKKVTLKADDAEVVVFFGTSPTFKKLYARENGQDNTYIVDYQSSELNPSADMWFNQDLLKVNMSDLDLVEFQDIVLEQDDGILGFSVVPDNKVVDRKELQGFVTKLTEIDYTDIPLKTAPEGWDKAPVIVSYDLTVKGDKQNYLIKGPIKTKAGDKELENYLIKSSRYPYYFQVSKYEVDALTAFTLDKMMKDKEAEAPSEPVVDSKE